jgi:UDP-glucuronate 4-epimerase
MTTLITGGAGFIGSRLARRLLAAGEPVVILDNFDSYYPAARKRAHLADLAALPAQPVLIEADIRDRAHIEAIFAQHRPARVVHLAAMSGVRYSAARPVLYSEVNTTGSVIVLDAAQRHGAAQVVLGSTSSVYGETARVPFREDDAATTPLAPYPASKRAAELFAHSLHHLHRLNITVLRFFNVYGPFGRPDMMPLRALEAILHEQPIPVYGDGLLLRDWTYIDDVLDGIEAALHTPLGFDILNIGCGQPVTLRAFLEIYQRLLGKTAIIADTPTPPTEPSITYADNTRARERLGFAPKIDLETGLARTWAWYQAFQATADEGA